MKNTITMQRNYRILFILFALLTAIPGIQAQRSKSKQSGSRQIISYVDTNLDGSQKYLLRVDGKPFYMTNIQVRMDLLRHSMKWPAETREALVAQLVADGFNTLSIPVHWYEVEPEKDKLDWTILDEYLQLMNKYSLKMEMLWFGTNSGGHTQWLNPQWANTSKADPVHLRVPDYVLYTPQYGSPGWSRSQEEGHHETTSEFNIRRDMTNYTLDLEDTRLRDRETYVLSKVMAHIAEWDKANGSKHPVIGVQIGNEVRGQHVPFDNTTINSYLSHVAGAVKNSDYVVWTRVNCVFMDVYGRAFENERLRNTPEGTNLDFIGIDTYSHHFTTSEAFVASMRDNVPYVGKNYRMIMETNSEHPYSAQMHLAALSGNNAFDFYDAGGLYERDGNGVKARAPHIEDIRLVNKILTGALYDVARNAHGHGLFVHNWQGNKADATISPQGISFEPFYPTSQGVSIIRSGNELLLMTTKGGRFIVPASFNVISASQGHFDKNNNWKKEAEVAFHKPREGENAAIRVEAGAIVLLTCDNTGKIDGKSYQAEWADLCVGGDIQSGVAGVGFAGTGYVKFPSTAGSYIQFNTIDGQGGGKRTLHLRYSHGGKRDTRFIVLVNGEMNHIRLKPTGSYDNYQYMTFEAELKNGNNTIKLETNDNVARVNRSAFYESDVHIDELIVADVFLANENNPILPGYHADPEALYSHKTGKYYIYPTSDGYHNWDGHYFKAYSSADLKEWKDEGVILDFESDLAWTDKNAWAPCIIERKMPDGSYKYFYYYSAAKKIGVAVADNPTGPYVDPLGKPLIDYKLEGQIGGQQIDPDVFCDPQTGKYYLYWGCGYLAVAELNDDMISIKMETAKRITPPNYTEGTEVFCRNGLYYFMWSENDTRSEDYRVRYATAKSPAGPLDIPKDNLILSKIPAKGIYGTGHNCVLQIPGTDEWYIIYHRFRRPHSIKMGWAAGYHREVCMDKLEFNNDGSIRKVMPTL